MHGPSPRSISGPSEKEPPDELPDSGVLLGYSLEHQRRTAPIGFSYGSGSEPFLAAEVVGDTPTLDPILHTGGGHLMTIAPTGAGKGVSCVIPTLLRFQGPTIVIDPKGENYAVTAERRRQLGQQVVVLDPIGITGEEDVGGLNPLDLVETRSPQSIDDSAALASLLSGGVEKEDPRNLFWYQRGEQLLTGVIQFVAVARSGLDRSLSEVRRILNLPTEQFIHLARTEMASCSDAEVRQVAGTLANPAEEMIGSILSMSQNSMGFLRGEKLHQSTAVSSFSLDAVTAGDPLSIFLVIPPDKLESHRNLLRLWIGTLMAALMRRRAPVPHSTLLVLDEAAQLGPLEQLRQAVTLMRGYGLQTWSFWQDVSQLRNLYPRDWETMYNNCRVHQAFGLTTLRAAQATCDLLGFHDPLEALQLDSDEMILSVSGDEAVIAQKPNYLTDPAFEGLHQPNPFYTKSQEGPPRPRRHKRVYVRPTWPATGEQQGAATNPSAPAVEEPAVAKNALDDLLQVTAGIRTASSPSVDKGGPPSAVQPFTSALDPLPNVEVAFSHEVATLIDGVVDHFGGTWSPITAHVRGISPSFYDNGHFIELIDPGRDPGRQIVFKHGPKIRPFDGSERRLRELNQEVPLQLTNDNVAEYVRLYFHLTRPRSLPLRIVETLEQLAYWTGASEKSLSGLSEHIHGIEVQESEEGGWVVAATVLGDGALGEVSLKVTPEGVLENGRIVARKSSALLPAGYPARDLNGVPLEAERTRVLREVHGTWEVLLGWERQAVLDELSSKARASLPAQPVLLRRRVRCYPGYEVVRIPTSESPKLQFHFSKPGELVRSRRGSSGMWLHTFQKGRVRLESPEDATEFLRFFLWFMAATDSYWLLLDRFEHLPLREGDVLDSELEQKLRSEWMPMTRVPLKDDDPASVVFRFQATALRGDTVVLGDYLVRNDGTLAKDNSVTLAGDLPIDTELLNALMEFPPLGVAE